MLHHSFETAALRRPDHPALIAEGRETTYRELLETSRRFAGFLRQEAGLAPGDRVALCLDHSVGLVAGILGTLMARGAFVVVHPGVRSHKFAQTLDDCEPRVLVTDRTDPGSDLPGCVRVPGGPGFAAAIAGQDGSPVRTGADEEAGEEDLCCLVYTSGSTGPGKGVALTHRNTTFAADTISDYLRLTEDDVVLNFTPMAADYGLYNTLMPLRRGGTAVLQRGYLLPTQILDAIDRHRVTGLALVPTIIAMFLQAGGLEDQDFGGVRYLSSTGQVLPTAHIARLRQLMPGCAIYSMYGLTECKRVAYLDPSEIDRRPDSVGRALAGTEVWLVDELGRRLPPPLPGQRARGELVIRGDHVMRGYWNRPEETAACLRPDPEGGGPVLHSGDEFEIDGEGFLYFVSRRDDLIKSSGERISPREIEDCIFGLRGVTAVVVTGVPDEILGAAVHARVVVDPAAGIDGNHIRAHCTEHLERALVPKYIELCDAIPLTPSGKLKR